jgi:hypothetical protein
MRASLSATRRYATAATPVLMPRFEIEAVLDTTAGRRCDSEHMRSADPIAARFPRPSLPPDLAARDGDRWWCLRRIGRIHVLKSFRGQQDSVT